MSNEIIPLVSLNNLQSFGTPHHGKVEGGILTKTDSTTMPYNQPATGDVNLIEFSGLAAIGVDASAAGFVDYGLKSGGSIYAGPAQSDFLYRASDGNVWGVTVTNGSTVGTTFSFDVELFRFGRVSIPHTDLSADTTIQTSFADGEVSAMINSNIVFCNSSPDGKKAIYQFGEPHPFYIEIGLSGAMDLGVMTGISISVSVEKKPSEVGSMLSAVNDASYYRKTVSANDPTATGSIGVPAPVSEDDPPISGSQAELTFSLVDGALREDIDRDFLVKNIVWAFYSESNTIKYVAAEAHFMYLNTIDEVAGSMPAATWDCARWFVGSRGGGYVWVADGKNHNDTIVSWGEHSVTVHRSLEITLLVDGIEVDNMKSNYINDGGVSAITEDWGVYIFDASDASARTWNDNFTLGVITPTDFEDTGFDADIDGATTVASYVLAVGEVMKTAYDLGTAPQFNNLLNLAGHDFAFGFEILTNNMACLVYADKSDIAKTKRYSIAHPEGIATGSYLGDPAGLHYSFHPKTSEVIRENTNPICFV